MIRDVWPRSRKTKGFKRRPVLKLKKGFRDGF